MNMTLKTLTEGLPSQVHSYKNQYIYVIQGLICVLPIIFSKTFLKKHNKGMCQVIESEHSNWMRPYIMLSISLRKDAKNEFVKVSFKLMNNRVFGKTMENIRRMSWSRNFKMVILKNVDCSAHKIWHLPEAKGMNKYLLLWKCSALDKRDPRHLRTQ